MLYYFIVFGLVISAISLLITKRNVSRLAVDISSDKNIKKFIQKIFANNTTIKTHLSEQIATPAIIAGIFMGAIITLGLLHLYAVLF
jgi:hypothetical protein